jgi:1-acyl-sn-glycerol-3-phosphate acyltransferase
MTQELRDVAPSAEEIERRFSSAAIIGARPLVLSGIAALKMALHFSWDARFDRNLRRLKTPLIFASNHRSHADTAAILGTLPKKLRHRTAVAAALDVFGADANGGIRRRISKDFLQLLVGAGFHAFAFDRFGPPLRSVRTSVQLIRNGWSLLLYPEGTRSRNGDIAAFKAGVGLLARFSGRPVIPVHVEGGENILPYGAFLPRAARATVRYGSPLWYQPNETPVTFAAKVEEQVRLLGVRTRAAAGPKPFDTRTAQPSKQPA